MALDPGLDNSSGNEDLHMIRKQTSLKRANVTKHKELKERKRDYDDEPHRLQPQCTRNPK
ncbi:hypothetical protein MMC14_009616, partial [Varicellaria rhodocarpa]|nr:hypothetical protein [Varicellaria rhodocarpa]